MTSIKDRYNQGGWRWMLPAFIVATTIIAAVVLALVRDADAHTNDHDSARTVYLGNWAGLARCEAPAHTPNSIDANERNHTGSGASGAFQLMPRTHRWVAERHGRHALTTKHPTELTVAQQLRQAIRLRDMPGGGLRHWACHTYYGRGPGWVTVYDEPAMPKHPRRCARTLHRNLGAPKRVARSVCGVT